MSVIVPQCSDENRLDGGAGRTIAGQPVRWSRLAGLVVSRRRADAPLPIRAAQIPILRKREPAVSPEPGTFVARPGLPALTMALPLDWDQDPHADRNWRAQLNMLRMADEHVLAFEQTDDPRFLRWLVALLLDWHRFHVVQGRTSRYGWGDMIVGQRAARLAYVLAAARVRPGIATWRERRTLAASAVAHAARIVDINPVRMSNHVFDDMLGLRALIEVLPADPWRPKVEAFIGHYLPRLLAMQFGEAGVHRENSPGYQSFGIGKLEQLVDAGWFEGFGVAELLAQAREVDSWLRTPENRYVPIGDTDGYAPRPLQRLAPQQTGQFRAGGYLVRRDRTLEREQAPAGYFAFMGSAQAPFHKHNDDLSWHWHDGVPIVTDTGKYAYLNDEARDYAISARAHSTVEIDGRDPLPATLGELMAHPMGGDLLRHVDDTAVGMLVSGRTIHARLGAAHTRTLLYRPGRFVLVADIVEDILQEGDAGEPESGPRPITQWTHFAPAIQLRQRNALRYAAKLPDGRPLDVRLASPNSELSTELVRGALVPRRQGWASEAYARLTPRDALGLTVPHEGTSRLGSIVAIGEAPRRLLWTGQNRLRAEFSDEIIVLTPDMGRAGDAPSVVRRLP